MKEKEILKRFIENESCGGVSCVECKDVFGQCFWRKHNHEDEEAIRAAKQRLKEIEMEVPKLVGKKMLVSNDGKHWNERYVFGRMTDGTYVASRESCEPNFYVWQKCKPIPEVEELTIEQVCAELGREVKIKK